MTEKSGNEAAPLGYVPDNLRGGSPSLPESEIKQKKNSEQRVLFHASCNARQFF